MNCCIINIGDELLSGLVVNSNAAFMARELEEIGIRTIKILCIPDKSEDIIRAIRDVDKDIDLLIFTGGLGPTGDDITKNAVCEAFDDELIENSKVLEHIRLLLNARGFTLTETNRMQSLVPSRAEILINEEGTAPGLLFDTGKHLFCFLPGVPFEMEGLLKNKLLPLLSERFQLKPIRHFTLLTLGKGESFLADILKDFELSLPEGIKLAYLPQPGIVRLRLSILPKAPMRVEKDFDACSEELSRLVSYWVFGKDDDTIEEIVGELLLRKGMSLSVAESCTGGYLSSLITTVPGCSQYYKGGVVAYDNALKVNVLGVSVDTLNRYGAVSREVVDEMAEGCISAFQTECSIAISGIAGPGGATPDKEVGLIWIAVKTPTALTTQKLQLGKNRVRNNRIASLTALNMLRKALSG